MIAIQIDNKRKIQKANRPKKAVAKPAPKGSRIVPGRRRGGARANVTIAKKTSPIAVGSTKIVISNLAQSVSQQDVLQLFSQIGKVRSAQLNYDANGRSKGVATVIFQRPGDAERAIKEYNSRTLDNRPMRIEVILDPAAVAKVAKSLPGELQKGRLGASNVRPAGKKGGVVVKQGKGKQTTAAKKAQAQKKKVVTKAKRAEKPKAKTQDELDAEIAAYMSSNQPSA